MGNDRQPLGLNNTVTAELVVPQTARSDIGVADKRVGFIQNRYCYAL